uniref:transposase n=1 Tax=Prochlorothrix hollandica TaxID=1223 RepID=UPI000344E67F|nr:transposase [Prochlorothrix hollandica]
MICDLETANLIEVIDSHQQDKIIEILMEWPLEVREAITEVSIDMWGGFTKSHPNCVPKCTYCI